MRLIAIFAAASLSVVVLGAYVCALSDIPPAVWLRNLAAWLVGALAAAAAFAVRANPRWLPVPLLAAPATLAAAFLGDGLSGVHRWIEAGPLRLNAAMLVLPALVVALACTQGLWRWAAALACLLLLVLQPDASQAAALAAAALVAVRSAKSLTARVVIVAACAGLAAMAWLRPDPLEPVAEVEGIVGLAARASPLLAAASLALLAAVALAPGLASRRAAPDLRLAGAALTVCLGVWTLAPFLGAFPVPFMGVGPSPLLGAWLGVGLLAGLERNRPSPAAATRPDAALASDV